MLGYRIAAWGPADVSWPRRLFLLGATNGPLDLPDHAGHETPMHRGAIRRNEIEFDCTSVSSRSKFGLRPFAICLGFWRCGVSGFWQNIFFLDASPHRFGACMKSGVDTRTPNGHRFDSIKQLSPVRRTVSPIGTFCCLARKCLARAIDVARATHVHIRNWRRPRLSRSSLCRRFPDTRRSSVESGRLSP